MHEYHKIDSVYKRDTKGKMIFGDYSNPEFEYLANNKWEFTEKIDGTNIRVIWNGSEVSFRGRTDNADTPKFLLDELASLFPVEKMKEILGHNDVAWHGREDITLYGEGYGARIQKGGGNYIPDGCSFILFDVLVRTTDNDWWLDRSAVDEIAKKLGINSVPVIGYGTLPELVDWCRVGLTSVFGPKPFPAEGIVARPMVTFFNRKGERIITKMKLRDFK